MLRIISGFRPQPPSPPIQPLIMHGHTALLLWLQFILMSTENEYLTVLLRVMSSPLDIWCHPSIDSWTGSVIRQINMQVHTRSPLVSLQSAVFARCKHSVVRRDRLYCERWITRDSAPPSSLRKWASLPLQFSHHIRAVTIVTGLVVGAHHKKVSFIYVC